MHLQEMIEKENAHYATDESPKSQEGATLVMEDDGNDHFQISPRFGTTQSDLDDNDCTINIPTISEFNTKTEERLAREGDVPFEIRDFGSNEKPKTKKSNVISL